MQQRHARKTMEHALAPDYQVQNVVKDSQGSWVGEIYMLAVYNFALGHVHLADYSDATPEIYWQDGF